MEKIIILIHQANAICFSSKGGAWKREPINGEPIHELNGKQVSLLTILNHFSDLRNEEHLLEGVDTHILYTEGGYAVIADSPSILKKLRCATYKIEALEPQLVLSKTASRKAPKEPLFAVTNDEWFIKILFPILNVPHESAQQTLQAQEAQEYADNVCALRSELAASQNDVLRLKEQLTLLKAQLAQKQAQLSTSQFPSIENLLTFLPVIYRGFWTRVRPDELALLAGTLTVPQIQSPYPDPTPDTVFVLKRRFMQLTDIDRERIRDFCRELPHRLEVRAEMRDVMGDD